MQDSPDHSNTNKCFPGTIIFDWESSSDLGSFIGASIELDKAETKSDICSFVLSGPLSLPSIELASEEYIGDVHLKLSMLCN